MSGGTYFPRVPGRAILKVLFDVQFPYAWVPGGGVQVHVNQLMNALNSLGVETQPLNWWDENQSGDVVSTFNWPTGKYLFAKKRGMKIVSYIFLDEFNTRTKLRRFFDRMHIYITQRFLKGNAFELGWCYPDIADAYIYPSQHDATLGGYLFGAARDKSFVILHGVPDQYFGSPNEPHVCKDYLISAARITESKNTVLLAKIAKEMKVPVLFLGKPLSNRYLLSDARSDPYFEEFMGLVDQKYVMYEGFIPEEEKIQRLNESRGFILLSKSESGCLAVLEALAARKQVFLPDYSWAREIYAGHATLGDMNDFRKLSRQVQAFYHQAECGVESIFPVRPWSEVAQKYLQVYESVLKPDSAPAS